MTVRTIETRLLQAVAIHAATHRDVGFAKELIASVDRTVAFFARAAPFQMCFMTEENVSRDLIHTRPLDVATFFRKRCELLNRRAVGLDSGMARHALRGCNHRHHLPWIGVGMARFAWQLQIAGVDLMTERNRLLGGLFGSLSKCAQNPNQYHG